MSESEPRSEPLIGDSPWRFKELWLEFRCAKRKCTFHALVEFKRVEIPTYAS